MIRGHEDSDSRGEDGERMGRGCSVCVVRMRGSKSGE